MDEITKTRTTKKNCKESHNKSIVTHGRDLRKIRIASGLTTAEMALEVGVKSRKTVENWERDFCEPSLNQWLVFCQAAGFHPGLVMDEIMKRNQIEPTMNTDIDLTVCLLK